VGLAVLGVPTTLVAMLGDDADGRSIRDFVASFGVELIATPSPRGTARAISDRTEGEPRYSFNEASVERWIEFDERVLAAIAAAPLVVVSCLRFDSAEQVALLEAAVDNPEARLVIDPNPRAGMLHSAPDFVANFERLAAKSLLTKVGDEDARLLYASSLQSLTVRLLEAGVRTLLTTAGREGAFLTTADGVRIHEPITPLDTPVVDTMGAGDATLASVTASLLEGAPATAGDWQAVLARAMAVAAATCRSEGALLRLPEPSPAAPVEPGR
jgi:fructokinase